MNTEQTSKNIFMYNNDSVLDFLDLSFHINEENNICDKVYDKPTNSFTYASP